MHFAITRFSNLSFLAAALFLASGCAQSSSPAPKSGDAKENKSTPRATKTSAKTSAPVVDGKTGADKSKSGADKKVESSADTSPKQVGAETKTIPGPAGQSATIEIKKTTVISPLGGALKGLGGKNMTEGGFNRLGEALQDKGQAGADKKAPTEKKPEQEKKNP